MDPSVLSLVSSFLGDGGRNKTKSDDATAGGSGNAKVNVAEGYRQDVGNDSCRLVKVLIFTKDRPWQLQQLLRSMKLRALKVKQKQPFWRRLEIILLACVQPTYESAYQQVVTDIQQEIHDKNHSSLFQISLRLLREGDDDSSFIDLLHTALLPPSSESAHSDNNNGWCVLFLTDDCLLLQPLQDLLDVSIPFVFKNHKDGPTCFLSRLHPGISWCQTRNLPSPPPHTQLCYSPHVYRYKIHRDTNRNMVDWSYPFDLSGGIYRGCTIQNLLLEQLPKQSMSHPNRLEIAGNQCLLRSGRKQDCPVIHVAVPTQPMLIILSWNRVQSIHQAPLAVADNDDSYSTKTLLHDCFQRNRHLDLDAYSNTLFHASHVGPMMLTPTTRNKKPPSLSVLIPIHQGPPCLAAHAMVSVLEQIIHATDSPWLSFVQIVLVDDRCTDGSVQAMMHEAATRASVIISDHRDKKKHDTGGAKAAEPSWTITMDVYTSPLAGVAAALKHGLSFCRGDFVARMDADDVCAPGRFLAQIRVLENHPHLQIVGTHTILFAENHHHHDDDDDNHDKNKRTVIAKKEIPYLESNDSDRVVVWPSLPPTDPGLTAWSMLFSCCLSHPSIMARNNNTLEYDDSDLFAEDYDLWLRLVHNDARCMTSIPRIGLWHRKKKGQQNPQKRKQQRERATILSKQAMEKRLGALDRDVVEVLLRHNQDATRTLVDRAARLLMDLEQAFLKKHNDLTVREKRLIRYDCQERLGELVVTNHRVAATTDSLAWKMWCQQCPERFAEQIALLLQTKSRDHNNVSSLPSTT